MYILHTLAFHSIGASRSYGEQNFDEDGSDCSFQVTKKVHVLQLQLYLFATRHNLNEKVILDTDFGLKIKALVSYCVHGKRNREGCCR